MPFILRPFAAVLDGYVTRFIDDATDLREGEVALPVVADPDPPVADNEQLVGPNYEVMADHIRAYGEVVKVEPSVEQVTTLLQQLGMNDAQLSKFLAAAAAI